MSELVKLSEADGFVYQLSRVGEETVGDVPSAVIRGLCCAVQMKGDHGVIVAATRGR